MSRGFIAAIKRAHLANIRDLPLAREVGMSLIRNEQYALREAKSKTLLEYSGCFDSLLIGKPQSTILVNTFLR